LKVVFIFYSIFTTIYKNQITITKHISLLFSLFFLLNIAGPTLVLLHSDCELSTMIISIDKESETKDIEDVKEFTELDFNKTNLQDSNPYAKYHSLSFVFYNKTLSEIHLETISPPPDCI
jgi:hypothetical protein